MNKLFTTLALSVALAASVSFAKNDFNKLDASKFPKDKKQAIEKSKDCRWVCENGEAVLYKGKKRVDMSNDFHQGLLGAAPTFTTNSECPSAPKMIDCRK